MFYLFLWLVVGVCVTMVWKWFWEFGHHEGHEQFVLGCFILAWPLAAVFVILPTIGKLPGYIMEGWAAYQQEKFLKEREQREKTLEEKADDQLDGILKDGDI